MRRTILRVLEGTEERASLSTFHDDDDAWSLEPNRSSFSGPCNRAYTYSYIHRSIRVATARYFVTVSAARDEVSNIWNEEFRGTAGANGRRKVSKGGFLVGTRRMADCAKPLHNEAGACFYVSHARVLLVIIVFAPMNRSSLSYTISSLSLSLSYFPRLENTAPSYSVIPDGIVISCVGWGLRILVKHGRSN